MTNQNLIKILENISFLLELKGENKFKILTYKKAIEIIEDNDMDIENLVLNNELKNVIGFGEALVSKIQEFVKTGKIDFYEKLKIEYPESLCEINKIKGLGVVKIRFLYDILKITNISELSIAIENGQLSNVKGFTEKLINQIKKGIENIITYSSKTYYHLALDEANEIIENIKSIGYNKVRLVGDIPMFENEIDKIEIIIGLDSVNLFDFNHLKSNLIFYQLEELENPLFYKFYVSKAKSGIKIELGICDNQKFELLYHNLNCKDNYFETLKEFIKYSGYQLEKDKFIDNLDNEIFISNELELYKNIGFSFVNKENRIDSQAVEFAQKYILPQTVNLNDLKGMLHCHSNWSDGRNSLREMALATKKLGYEYFGICDHSKTASYANGLSIERVLEQHYEIDKLNSENLGIRIIKGIESDILPDGSLDYPDEILEKFDFVVASVHSSFNMELNEMTERVNKAISNKYTTILGHPTGRLILKREAYKIDLDEIIRTSAEFGKVIEINSNPYRLDFDYNWSRIAKAKGVKLAINPDAHNINGLKHNQYGVLSAKKAWLTKSDVINTLSCNEFLNFSKILRNK